MTEYQQIIFASFLLAGIGASFGLPFQALMFLLAAIHGAFNVVEFAFLAFLYVLVNLFANFRRGVR